MTLPYTTTAVVIAHTFVSIPFYILSVEGALRAAGEELDLVAATLGADRWTTFRRVTLPLALPGVIAGAALAWARSLGEFGATITFAGNYPGTTQTMPSKIYTALQSQPDVARTLSMILLVVSVGVLALPPQPLAHTSVSGLQARLAVPGRLDVRFTARAGRGRGRDRSQRGRQDDAARRPRRAGAGRRAR